MLEQVMSRVDELLKLTDAAEYWVKVGIWRPIIIHAIWAIVTILSLVTISGILSLVAKMVTRMNSLRVAAGLDTRFEMSRRDWGDICHRLHDYPILESKLQETEEVARRVPQLEKENKQLMQGLIPHPEGDENGS